MSLRNGVKCGRCDRRYSVLRSKCPYCGARRNKASKRVASSDGSTWKLIVGLLILFVLIAAVLVLLVTTLKNAPKTVKTPETEPADEAYSQSEGVDSEVDETEPTDVTDPEIADPDVGEEPVEEAPVQTAIQSVIMKCFGAELSKSTDGTSNYDISMKVGDRLSLTYATTPEITDPALEWSTSDSNVAMILQSGQLTAVGKGTATITLTISGTSATCTVRVS